jgi:hypothetical protein
MFALESLSEQQPQDDALIARVDLAQDSRLAASGDVEELSDGGSDDVAGGGVIGLGSTFDCGAKVGVEAHGNDFGGRRAHQLASSATTKFVRVVPGFGFVGEGCDGSVIDDMSA